MTRMEMIRRRRQLNRRIREAVVQRRMMLALDTPATTSQDEESPAPVNA